MGTEREAEWLLNPAGQHFSPNIDSSSSHTLCLISVTVRFPGIKAYLCLIIHFPCVGSKASPTLTQGLQSRLQGQGGVLPAWAAPASKPSEQWVRAVLLEWNMQPSKPRKACALCFLLSNRRYRMQQFVCMGGCRTNLTTRPLISPWRSGTPQAMMPQPASSHDWNCVGANLTGLQPPADPLSLQSQAAGLTTIGPVIEASFPECSVVMTSCCGLDVI